jgi:hypothetical protein
MQWRSTNICTADMFISYLPNKFLLYTTMAYDGAQSYLHILSIFHWYSCVCLPIKSISVPPMGTADRPWHLRLLQSDTLRLFALVMELNNSRYRCIR